MDGWKEGGREGVREGQREGGREGGWEGGREREFSFRCTMLYASTGGECDNELCSLRLCYFNSYDQLMG